MPFTQCIYITFFCLLTASTVSKLGVVSLLLDSKATITHEALTMMLQIPLVATDTGSSLPGGAEHLRYVVRMGPSEHDISAAIQGIIGYHNWTNLLVMYDGEFTKEEFFSAVFFGNSIRFWEHTHLPCPQTTFCPMRIVKLLRGVVIIPFVLFYCHVSL